MPTHTYPSTHIHPPPYPFNPLPTHTPTHPLPTHSLPTHLPNPYPMHPQISAWNKDLVGTVDDTIGEYVRLHTQEAERHACAEELHPLLSHLALTPPPSLPISLYFSEFFLQTESLSKKCGDLLARLASARAGGDKNDDVEILEPIPDLANEGKKWIKLFHPSARQTSKGEVQIQYTLMAVKKADKKPVGEGQDEPNRDPVLPLPERAKLNLFDPMGSLMTLIGPERLKQVLVVVVATIVVRF